MREREGETKECLTNSNSILNQGINSKSEIFMRSFTQVDLFSIKIKSLT